MLAFLHKGIGLRHVLKTDPPAGKKIMWSVEQKFKRPIQHSLLNKPVATNPWNCSEEEPGPIVDKMYLQTKGYIQTKGEK